MSVILLSEVLQRKCWFFSIWAAGMVGCIWPRKRCCRLDFMTFNKFSTVSVLWFQSTYYGQAAWHGSASLGIHSYQAPPFLPSPSLSSSAPHLSFFSSSLSFCKCFRCCIPYKQIPINVIAWVHEAFWSSEFYWWQHDLVSRRARSGS